MSSGRTSNNFRDDHPRNLGKDNDRANRSDEQSLSRKRPREERGDKRAGSRRDSDTDRHRHRHHQHHHEDSNSNFRQPPVVIHEQDIADYFGLFRAYVKEEKGVEIHDRKVTQISDLNNRELDLWKRFARRWNAGRAGKHWYESYDSSQKQQYEINRTEPTENKGSEDDDFGPPISDWQTARQGPVRPSSGDLEAYLEEEEEEEDYRQEQLDKSMREQQQAALDQVAPAAGEPGSKSRIMEKRMAQRSADREYRERSPGGQEVAEEDLMGTSSSAMETPPSSTATTTTTKPRGISSASLRQRGRGRGGRGGGARIDRRAVVEERERQERMEAAQVKEKKTVEMLKKLAQERFGSAS